MKNWEARSVPLAPDLAAKLGAWKRKHGSWRFVFGKHQGTKVNVQFLAILKRFVRKAGMNCGHSETCVAKQKCKDWTLHRFRHVFASMCMRKGINPRTPQAWLGHSSLPTTMKYLASLADDAQAVEKTADVFSDFMLTKVIEMPKVS